MSPFPNDLWIIEWLNSRILIRILHQTITPANENLGWEFKMRIFAEQVVLSYHRLSFLKDENVQ